MITVQILFNSKKVKVDIFTNMFIFEDNVFERCTRASVNVGLDVLTSGLGSTFCKSVELRDKNENLTNNW
jgi:hypothetical protein